MKSFVYWLIASLLFVSPALAADTAQMINLSCRAWVGDDAEQVIAGFVILAEPNAPANARKRVLVRAVGPTLADMRVTGVAVDTKVTLYQGQTVVATNDDWDNSVAMQQTFRNAGAFPLRLGSKDAALVADLAPGAYTAVMSVVGGQNGVGLVEVYDLSRDTGVLRFINLSARVKAMGNQTQSAIVGFVYDGMGQRQILARGIGPSLEGFGLRTSMLDTWLDFYNAQGQIIISNNNWGGGSNLVTAMARAGAFALSASSEDAAVLVPLSITGASSFTVKVGTNPQNPNTATRYKEGVVLAEIYEVRSP